MTIMTRLASSSITSTRLNLGMYSIEMRNSPLDTDNGLTAVWGKRFQFFQGKEFQGTSQL